MRKRDVIHQAYEEVFLKLFGRVPVYDLDEVEKNWDRFMRTKMTTSTLHSGTHTLGIKYNDGFVIFCFLIYLKVPFD